MKTRSVNMSSEESNDYLLKWLNSLTDEETKEYERLQNEESSTLEAVPCLEPKHEGSDFCPIGINDGRRFGLMCCTKCKEYINHLKATSVLHAFVNSHGEHVCELCTHRDLNGNCDITKKFKSPASKACNKYNEINALYGCEDS